MGRYSKEHNDFFNAIKTLERDVETAVKDPSVRTVVRTAKLMNKPSNFPKAMMAFEIMKHGSAEIPEDINPIKLKNFLVDSYKADWLDWLPEVTDQTLFGEEKSEILSNKIQAIRACLTTDTPWQEWHVFENVGKAFNHQVPNFVIIQPLTLGECITTMDTMSKLRPEEPFSEEVLSYVASVAANNDYVYLPEELLVGKAQEMLDGFIFDKDLSLKTKAAWGKIKDRDVLNAKFSDDDSVHRQLAKLALAQQYYREFVE